MPGSQYGDAMNETELAERDLAAAEDRQAAAAAWKRGYSQYRAVLVQHDRSADKRTSTLGKLVNARQHRALLLYMMLLSVWPWLRDRKYPLEAHVWMQLLHSRVGAGDHDFQSLVWSESTLSRTWKYLAKENLVSKQRGAKGRLRVTPRREDGLSNYEFPDGSKDWNEIYFTLPDRFWLDEDFARLSLPGLAVLLVIAKETNQKPSVRMTQDQMAEWYGFSRATVTKGLADLRKLGLLVEDVRWIPARLSKIRTTKEVWFSLAGDYSMEARKLARNNAERRRRRAEKKAAVGFGQPEFGEEDGEDYDGDAA